jgi:hypothetical protein
VTSTDEQTGTDFLLAATPAEVEQGICREFLKRGFTADDPVLIDPDLISAVMVVVGSVIDAKDAEITRLRAAVRSAASTAENVLGGRLAVLVENARASERRRCANELDSLGFIEAAGVLTNRADGGPL